MMNNNNRYPGARGRRPIIPIRYPHRVRPDYPPYHQLRQSGQLWSTGSWVRPYQPPRATGPRVGMTVQQRRGWTPYQNNGVRGNRVYVHNLQHHDYRPSAHHSHFGVNACSKSNGEKRPEPSPSERRGAAGRGLWPSYVREQVKSKSPSHSGSAMDTTSTAPELVRADTSDAVSIKIHETSQADDSPKEDKQGAVSDPMGSDKNKVFGKKDGTQDSKFSKKEPGEKNTEAEQEIQDLSKLNISDNKSYQTESVKEITTEKSLTKTQKLPESCTKSSVSTESNNFKSRAGHINSRESSSSTPRTPVKMEKVFKKSKSWSVGPLSPNIKDALAKTPLKKSRLKTDLGNVCERLHLSSPKQKGDKTVLKKSKEPTSADIVVISDDEHKHTSDKRRQALLECVVEIIDDDGKPAKQSSSSSAKSPKVGSPEAKSSEAKSPEVKSSEVKSSEVKSSEAKSPKVKRPEVNHEIKNSEAKHPEVKSSETKHPEVKSFDAKHPEVKSSETKSPEVKSEAKKPEVKSSETGESSGQSKSSPNKSSMQKEKSKSSPILKTLSEKKLPSSGAATGSATASRAVDSAHLSSSKITEGIKNLRKMFKSTSFANSGTASTSSVKSETVTTTCTSVKCNTNNSDGVKMEIEVETLGADVKLEAGCKGFIKDDKDKIISGTAVEADAKDDGVKLDGSEAEKMDTKDSSMSFSQSSNYGTGDMFKSDSFLWDDSSRGAIFEDSDDDELPAEDNIGMAMTKILSKVVDRKPKSDSEDESSSRKRSRSPPSRVKSERKMQSSKSHKSSKESRSGGKLTLDNLLADHEKTADELQALKDMEKKLKEGIAAGGVDRFVDAKEEDEDLLPEHEDQLKSFAVKDSRIPEEHPGEPVFNGALCGKLYSLPDRCRLKEDFHFVAGSSRIDQMLANASPDMIEEILQSDIILTCISRISDPTAVLNWLFHLMSIHTNSLTSKCIQDLLYRVLHMTRGATSVTNWVPSFKEIFKLFVNYGADCDSLFVILEVADEVNELVPNVANQAHNNNVANNELNQSSFRLENLKFVLRVLTWALQQRPDRYSAHILKLYTLLTCRVALAEQLTQGYHTYDFEALISAQLGVLDENEWSAMETWLCTYLPNITDQHHNKVYLTEIMPYTDRGLHLKRRLSFCMLQQLIKSGETARSPENLVVQHLQPFVQKMRIMAKTDYYELSSIINLIDTCIGNEALCQTDREDLKLQMEKLGRLKSGIKETITQLDRTTVKDQIVWLETKWKFRVQNRSQNQQSMFAYTSNRVVEEVNVVSIQDDDESEDEIDPVDLKLETEEDSSSEAEELNLKLEIKEEVKEEIKLEPKEEMMDTS